ncbi:MAG: serine/threonine-protein kinase [Myxococcota bacterium]
MSVDPLPEDEDLPAGEVVGEYTVEHKLGEGAFGKVFKARHPLIGKEVAIKVLTRKFASDPEVVSRFIAEARAVNEISHRNIIDIFSFGKLPDGRQYFVMEYLRGKPLDAVLRGRVRLSLEEAMPILKQLARALDAAHQKGIAHRDLKPANVFISVDDEGAPFPKLLDFGVAKLVRSDRAATHKTATGSPIGTPYYMSPEQSRAENVDVRTDIYSFGVMCFQLLTGTLPFTKGSSIEVLFQHLTEAPPLPSTRAPEVPAALDAPILAMMAKSPDDRPASLGAAVRGLEEAGRSVGLLSAISDVSGPHPEAVGLARTLAQPPLVSAPPAGDALSATLSATAGGKGLERPRPKRGPIVVLSLAVVAVAGLLAVAMARAPSAVVVPVPSPAQAQVPSQAPVPTAAPTLAPAASPSPASPSPSQPAMVKLTLRGTPVGAEVVLPSGAELCKLPCSAELPRGNAEVMVLFKAKGFEPKKTPLLPTADLVVEVALEKKRSIEAPKKTRPQKDDIENAF